ncbi:uncharacterized protein LOC125498699 [Beta vulgaris subsp. vulgaris]|uniref:uncharacterized protein LOC125498699 n=1 Tax=Beta vulgaris subsp. vulgaris TaxID=3555 RepID=UPI002036E39F|nr:uncharacterized protein LOC125498699 [Beta vulgaris subsp. vulgaris]
MKRNANDERRRCIEPIPILQMSDHEVESNPSDNADNAVIDNIVKNLVKIEVEDVQPEVDFWMSSVICYIVGFIRRIWRNNGVDKVAMLKKGVYIVRFITMEKKDSVLNGPIPFFDSKPMIVRAWEQDMDVIKDQFEVVPTWIQMKVDFKYWNEKCLAKFVSPIGNFVKVDAATAKREKLQYARVMIEVKIDQEFPDQLSFVNKKGIEVVIEVNYEWKPEKCFKCKQLGHKTELRNRGVMKQVWREKEAPVQICDKPGDVKPFQEVNHSAKKITQTSEPVVTMNPFNVLNEMEDEQVIIGTIPCEAEKGINSMMKQKEVKMLLNKKSPGMVSLIETKVKAKNMGKVYQSLFSGWCFCSNSSYHNGGRVILAWNPLSFQVDIRWMSAQAIHYFIKPTGTTTGFCSTFVYAFNNAGDREQLWKDLMLQADTMTEPSIIGGDFNCVLNKGERLGALVKDGEMEAFRRFVNNCGLDDIKSNGCYYTWNNKQQGSDRVFSKLDRALGNEKWRDLFSTAEAMFMDEGLFDHTPILIRVHEGVSNIKTPFKYFHMWSMGEDFMSKVHNSWRFHVRGYAMFKFTQKLKQVKKMLKEMNKQGFSQIHIEDTKASLALQEDQPSMLCR